MTKFKLDHRTCPEPDPHCHALLPLHHRDTKRRMPTAWLWVPPCSLSLPINYCPGAPHARMGCHPLDMWGAHLLSRKVVGEKLVVEPPAAKLSTNSPGGRAPGGAEGEAERAGGSTQPSLKLEKLLCGLCCPFSSFLLPPLGRFLDFLGERRAENPGASLWDQEAWVSFIITRYQSHGQALGSHLF